MTTQELLTENKELIIESLYCKIHRLEQKQKYNRLHCPAHSSIPYRDEKIDKLKTLLKKLENEVSKMQ